MTHVKIALDPNEQINLRYRLFARAIRLNGVAQLESLVPYFQVRLEQTFTKELDAQLTHGNIWTGELLHKH